MKFLFDIGHPADVHYFRNTINFLQDRGHAVRIYARDKDVTHKLLSAYGFEFVSKGRGGRLISDRLTYTIKSLQKLHEGVSDFNPDICVSHASPYLAMMARLHGVPNIMFNDTERAALFKTVLRFFKPEVYSPDSFTEADENRQKLVPSYMELAYLHPDHFNPNEKIKEMTGENYILLRFVGNHATHDLGYPGITDDQKREMVERLKHYATVWISSEESLPDDLQAYRLQVSEEQIHDVIAFSRLVMGGSGTMSSEAAMLGVPAIFVNNNRLGYINELGDTYGLVYRYRNRKPERENALQRAAKILEDKHTEKYAERRRKMLADKQNMTRIMLDIISQKAVELGKEV
ncbi:MAG: DUF354 domain-containing protein [Balneolaceae bacterium]|nr:MAG: DUF354 domain-containing protein [Balneolaceae bacterium]